MSDLLAGVGAALISIRVLPLDVSVLLGGTAPFTAIGQFANGATLNITSEVFWKTADANIATITNGLSGGVVTGVAFGTAQVTASFAGISGSASVSVVDASDEDIWFFVPPFF